MVWSSWEGGQGLIMDDNEGPCTQVFHKWYSCCHLIYNTRQSVGLSRALCPTPYPAFSLLLLVSTYGTSRPSLLQQASCGVQIIVQYNS